MANIANAVPVEAPSTDPVQLSVAQRESIAREKATCPFVGSAVKTGDLAVRNSASRPLAAVDDIVALGDSGGGDLGSKVLKVFAIGNHSRMLGSFGRLDVPAPAGMMSLDLAGSQGAHPGHSGILLGDPTALDAGRFSATDFDRLAEHVDANGYLSTQAIGAFISENLDRDPNSKCLPIGRLAIDLFGLVDEIGDSLFAKLLSRKTERDEVELLEKLTKLAGEDNLIGSAGEFGLLFAFLANRPGPDRKRSSEIRFEDVREMMVHYRFPVGWKAWPKTAADWIRATTDIAAAAAKEHLTRSLRG